MAKILNALAYADDTSTYVAPPLAALEGTLGQLENRYYENRDTADKLEIALSNINVTPENEWIKQNAVAQMKGTLKAIQDKGDWEHASLVVRDAAKNFATDTGLAAAMQDKQAMDAQKAALKQRVGAEKNGILDEDYEWEIANADLRYKAQNEGKGGLYQDPVTKSWKGQWTLNEPPAYEDRAAKVDKFLSEYKPDTMLGSLMKKADGKWYKVDKYEKTPDGGYWNVIATEEAPFEEVYNAAKTYLAQEQSVQNRINYELGKIETKDYTWYEARGINRKAMESNLEEIGAAKTTDLENLSDDEVTDLYKREMVTYSSIFPAVAKHAYTKQTLNTIGQTWDMIRSIKEIEHRKKAGGDEKSVEHFNIIEQTRTGAYQHDIPTDVDKYTEVQNITNTELRKHQQTLKGYREILEKDPLWQDFQSGKIDGVTFAKNVKNTQTYADFMNTKATIVSLENQLTVNNAIYQRAVAAAAEEVNMTPEENEAYIRYNTLKQDPEVKAGLAYYESLKPVGVTGMLRPNPRPSASALQKADEYNALSKKYTNIFGNDKIQETVNKKMNEYYQNTVTDYNAAILDDDGFGKPSYFSERSTQRLKESSDDFYIVRTDGRTQEFSNKDTKDIVDLKNVKVVGYTTQTVGKHGFGLVVQEMTFAEDDKERKNPIGTKQHIVIPKVDPAFYKNLAINQVRSGYKVEKGKLSEGYDLTQPNVLESIWAEDGIDKQMSDFEIFPPVSQENGAMTTTLPISVGAKYKFNVTRTIMPNGQESWNVSGVDEKGKPVKAADGTDVVTYANRYEVEFALESLSGMGRKVPLALLEPVGVETFSKIKTNESVSTPYLHGDFINELRKLDNILPIELEFTGMTRDLQKNAKVNGAEDSKHLLGLGADFKLTPEVTNFLINNFADETQKKKIKERKTKRTQGEGFETNNVESFEEEGLVEGVRLKVPNSNLTMLIHDAGTGQHLHVETSSMPANIEKFTKFKP